MNAKIIAVVGFVMSITGLYGGAFVSEFYAEVWWGAPTFMLSVAMGVSGVYLFVMGLAE